MATVKIKFSLNFGICKLLQILFITCITYTSVMLIFVVNLLNSQIDYYKNIICKFYYIILHNTFPYTNYNYL